MTGSAGHELLLPYLTWASCHVRTSYEVSPKLTS